MVDSIPLFSGIATASFPPLWPGASPQVGDQLATGSPWVTLMAVVGAILILSGLLLISRAMQRRQVARQTPSATYQPPPLRPIEPQPPFSAGPAPLAQSQPVRTTPVIPRDVPASALVETRVLQLAGPHLEPTNGLPALPITLPATIGRAMDNQVVIGDTTSGWETISRHHARIYETTDGQIVVEDLGSQNGVYVNGQRITQTLLKDGWLVKFGDVEYIFRL